MSSHYTRDTQSMKYQDYDTTQTQKSDLFRALGGGIIIAMFMKLHIHLLKKIWEVLTKLGMVFGYRQNYYSSVYKYR